MRKYKKLLLNIFIFGIGGIGQKILSFFLIPLYTSYLSTEDYGTVDLLINSVQLFFPILNLSIHDALLSFALDKKNNPKEVCTIAAKYDAVSIGIFLCGTIVLRCIGIIQISNYYLVFVCVLYVINLWNLYFSIVAKIYNRIMLLAISGLCNTLLYLILNIFMLKYLLLGVEGYMIAYISGIILATLILIIGLYRESTLIKCCNNRLSMQMRRFSTPLVFNQAAWWINNLLDRYMLAWLAGPQLNGIYSVAYKLPNLLSTCQWFVIQAWSISAIEEHDDIEVKGYYSKVFSIYCFILSMIASVIMLFNNILSKILFRNDFYEARLYAPILLLAVTFSGYSYFMGSIFSAEKESMKVMKSTALGAATNLVLNIVLIPLFSIYGAAIATMISNLVMMVYRTCVLYRRNCIKIDIFRCVLVNVLLMVQVIFCGHKKYFLQIGVILAIILANRDLLYELYIRGKNFLNN